MIVGGFLIYFHRYNSIYHTQYINIVENHQKSPKIMKMSRSIGIVWYIELTWGNIHVYDAFLIWSIFFIWFLMILRCFYSFSPMDSTLLNVIHQHLRKTIFSPIFCSPCRSRPVDSSKPYQGLMCMFFLEFPWILGDKVTENHR